MGRKDNQLSDTINYIRSDAMRYYGNAKIMTLIKAYFRNKTFRWQVAFRLCKSKKLKYLGYFLWILNRNRKIMQIPRVTQVGYGLYIGHNGPVIVNPTAVIGNNVNLSQFTTIGSNGKGNAAKIGDNVYIGPNVCLVENVVIGDNVTIGAGSVVTKDIPDNATAAGNYAKVLNYNNPERFVCNRYEVKNH